MSRSYKHTPACNVAKPDGTYKRIFNRRIRRKHQLDIPSGGWYKKMNESYYIHDCRVVGCSFEKYGNAVLEQRPETPESALRDGYQRYYIRK